MRCGVVGGRVGMLTVLKKQAKVGLKRREAGDRATEGNDTKMFEEEEET